VWTRLETAASLSKCLPWAECLEVSLRGSTSSLCQPACATAFGMGSTPRCRPSNIRPG
jgi:hypothetical protein